MGTVRKGSDSKPERVVDNSKVEGAIYSTSGYGGYLETGTARMDPRPYIKPSFDMHGKNLANNIKAHLG